VPSARATADGAATRISRSNAELPSGTRAGRYVLLSRIGAGGAGEVYCAYDPQLDRKVAIKLLRSVVTDSLSASQGEARLLREGQAMARLKHPNVMPVYDVGTLEHATLSGVFVAMELVEGGTLREWLKTPRSRREILTVLTAAGRGLAAAHAAGLVHRDFKPDNVLIGSDGRVFVTDFGIVRATGTTDQFQRVTLAEDDVLAAPLTRMDAVVGTPAYMAPEQYRSEPVDARTDQFSFCVTLYEALTGERPFRGATFEELMAAAIAGKITTAQREGALPSWLRRVVLRGLEIEPARRHESMGALLDALADDPAIKRRRVLAIVGGLVALTAIGVTTARLASRNRELCRGADRKLAGVWDARVRAGLGRAFAATGLPAAPRIATTVAAMLDDYTGHWAAMHAEACEATRVRSEQPESVMNLRMSCLDSRLHELRALTGMFVNADAPLVQKSIDATGALSSIQRCADVAALTAPVPPPTDAVARARVEALRTQLAELKALGEAGRLPKSTPQVDALVGDARAVGYGPVLAASLALKARQLEESGQYKEAEPLLFESYTTAYAAHDDAVAADAAADLVALLGYWLGRAADGHRWTAIALAAIQRLGGNDEIEAGLLQNATGVDYQEGDAKRAIADAERALALGRKAFGDDSPRLAIIRGTLATAYQMHKRYDEALAENQRAIDIVTKAYGPVHQRIGAILTNMGNVATAQKRYDVAEGFHRRALAMVEKTLGPSHPTTGITLANLGDTLVAEKKFADAIPFYERALAIAGKAFDKENPDAVYPLFGLGSCQLGLGHAREAVELLERANTLGQKTSMDPQVMLDLRFTLGRALWAAGRDRARAVTLVQSVERGLEKDADPDVVKELKGWLATHRAGGP
jgi:tetratricopeptide (TPR) repeat protein